MKYVWLLLLLTGCLTGFVTHIPEETGTIEVFFCDQIDCTELFAERTNGANLNCAMYHIDKEFEVLLTDANLIVDEEHPIDGALKEKGSGLMHNKFCIFNDIVWTGSWNPSQGMTIPNNVVLIQSKTIAKAFQQEFDELSSGTFHGGKQNPGLVKLNGNLIEAYFCPEDNCQSHVLEVLSTAKESIHFMTFSFTDDEIGNLLVEKIDKGIDVRGVFDPRKNSYSEYDKLKDVSQVKKVHHKVFIIDGNIVITGSYNPTKNGNTRNDENIVIIHDPAFAKQFEEEFSRII